MTTVADHVQLPRAEYNDIVAGMRELRQQQEQRQAIQNLATATANQAVTQELAKTPLFKGDGVVSIDRWLKTIQGIFEQYAVGEAQQPQLLRNRLTGAAARFATDLAAADQTDYRRLTTALRTQYRTEVDRDAASLAFNVRSQKPLETVAQFAAGLKSLAAIAFAHDVEQPDDQQGDVPRAYINKQLRKRLLAGLFGQQLRRDAALHCPDDLLSLDDVVAWVTRLDIKIKGIDAAAASASPLEEPLNLAFGTPPVVEPAMANPFSMIAALQNLAAITTPYPPPPGTGWSGPPFRGGRGGGSDSRNGCSSTRDTRCFRCGQSGH